jgi:hypothetical protein
MTASCIIKKKRNIITQFVVSIHIVTTKHSKVIGKWYHI